MSVSHYHTFKNLVLAGFAVFIVMPVNASPFSDLAISSEGTLNDLIRRIPSNSRRADRELAKLSAIQEVMQIHDRRMRGAGLPINIANLANAEYVAILDAMVSDRLSEEDGRESLDLHSQLIDLAYEWADGAYADEPDFEGALIDAFATLLDRLKSKSVKFADVPAELRTPVVNGFQTWLIGLDTWGGDCRYLTASERVRIRNKARIFAKFERVYKADGRVDHYERGLLHRKLFELQRDVIEIIAG